MGGPGSLPPMPRSFTYRLLLPGHGVLTMVEIRVGPEGQWLLRIFTLSKGSSCHYLVHLGVGQHDTPSPNQLTADSAVKRLESMTQNPQAWFQSSQPTYGSCLSFLRDGR